MKKYLLSGLLLVFTVNIVAAENALLQQAINGEHRSTQHKNRDQFRHPQETLAFFEVEPTMTVVEIWPGGKGWYTEILAPYLKEKGTLYTAQFSATSDIAYFTKSLQAFTDKILARPDIYGNIKLSTLQPPDFLEIAPKASADRVLTFRNVHNWMKSGHAETVFKAMYSALKPGGILGIVEHRAPASTTQDPKAISGYVTEAYVIALGEKVGFKLLAKSEINANPKDIANYPEGVWTLPPTLRLTRQNKKRYLNIGESDRMTLKFIKP
jgi:predicted methyltransferase